MTNFGRSAQSLFTKIKLRSRVPSLSLKGGDLYRLQIKFLLSRQPRTTRGSVRILRYNSWRARDGEFRAGRALTYCKFCKIKHLIILFNVKYYVTSGDTLYLDQVTLHGQGGNQMSPHPYCVPSIVLRTHYKSQDFAS